MDNTFSKCLLVAPMLGEHYRVMETGNQRAEKQGIAKITPRI